MKRPSGGDTMTMMKAIRIHEYGGPDVLHYEDAPLPEPGEGDVLVRVHAAGLNPIDWKIREGASRSTYTLPLIPGWDFSGVIEKLGPGATCSSPGDAVYARPDIGRNGAYAEYIAVREMEVARKPRSLDHIEAAAVPLTSLTAWQSLIDTAQLDKGQTVLVHGAAGGVGTFAVQIAKWRGARVIAAASAHDAIFLRKLGADELVDYARQSFDDILRDVDVVFDTIGGETQKRSWKVLREGGLLVSIAGTPSEEDARAHRVRKAFVRVQPNAHELAMIARLIDEGFIEPVVSAVLPLEEAPLAHELSQKGHVRGKIVLSLA